MRKKVNGPIFAKYQGIPLEAVPGKYQEKSQPWPGFKPVAPVVKSSQLNEPEPEPEQQDIETFYQAEA